MISGAYVSADGRHRVALWRTWDAAKTRVCWVMLNPSTADAAKDDPTIRRCVGFAKAWGHGGILVVNLFAYRATDPRELDRVALDVAVGPGNDDAIVKAAGECEYVVAAWGNRGTRAGRGEAVLGMLHGGGFAVHCIGVTRTLQPAHPLYVRSDARPELLRKAREWVAGQHAKGRTP